MTTQGVLLAVGSYLWAHLDPSALSPTLATILQAAGTVWAAVGARNAVAKGPTP
jgi:hypothetical protein